MIRACFIVKYPPIEGGVSMRSYWMARELAERGHQIFIVTNAAEVEPEYRIYMDEDDQDWYEPQFADSGGFVRVRNTQPFTDAMTHIPLSNPFVTKLSSVATEVIRRHGCEVIFAYYLQPYGMAAYLASQWTGVPYMLKHAGSDLGRLMKQRDLTTAYREILKAADSVWTGSAFTEPFLAMGVKEENIWPGRTPQVPDIFSPQAKPLDLNGFLKRVATLQTNHVQTALINTNPIDLSKPSIGIYGKVGEVKGSFDLLNALRLLKQRGLDFNLLALTQGRALTSFKRAIDELDLQDRTWIFPFIPHWKVPGFIRVCTAVCFLEREFPISFHSPTIPSEILACGTSLIVSREISNKQHRLKDRFIDGQNVLIVDDPTQHQDLARQLSVVIRDPDKAKMMGLQGHKLYRGDQDAHAARDKASATYLDVLEKEWIKMIDKRQTQLSTTTDGAAPLESVRKEKLKARLPWTSLLLNGQWDRLVNEYCRQRIAPSAGPFKDALGLCEFLEPMLGALGSGYEYFIDAFRYEKTHNLMLLDRDAEIVSQPAWAPGSVTPVAGPAPRIGKHNTIADISDLRPLKSKGVHVQTFNYDLHSLATRLQQHDIPRELPKTPTLLLFKRERNFINLEYTINQATKYFLDLCDGTHTVRVISRKLAQFYHNDHAIEPSASELTERITELVRDLASKRILTLRRQ
jgi:glycosyltransferase involved in cell wall biosynthesis